MWFQPESIKDHHFFIHILACTLIELEKIYVYIIYFFFWGGGLLDYIVLCIRNDTSIENKQLSMSFQK